MTSERHSAQVQERHHSIPLAFQTTSENKHPAASLDVLEPKSIEKPFRLVYISNQQSQARCIPAHSAIFNGHALLLKDDRGDETHLDLEFEVWMPKKHIPLMVRIVISKDVHSKIRSGSRRRTLCCILRRRHDDAVSNGLSFGRNEINNLLLASS